MSPSPSKPNAYEAKILPVDETVRNLLQTNYPDGQSVNDALVIQVPCKKVFKDIGTSDSSILAAPHRQSPYAPPHRSTNSPLSGTLGLMTHDMHDFEYFPETPPIGQIDGTLAAAADYVNSGKNFVPSNYSSASPSQGGSTVLGTDGSVRAVPNLQLNTARYGARPGLGPRHATSASSNSGGGHNRSESSVTFYPKSARTLCESSTHLPTREPSLTILQPIRAPMFVLRHIRASHPHHHPLQTSAMKEL